MIKLKIQQLSCILKTIDAKHPLFRDIQVTFKLRKSQGELVPVSTNVKCHHPYEFHDLAANASKAQCLSFPITNNTKPNPCSNPTHSLRRRDSTQKEELAYISR